ncbi:MAG TPA: monoheme cytochrome SoxX [Thiobacillaceae bacterium]|nr:monoheme cytochrome SoxX [Thiobacillaceae bacterium]
MAETQFFVHLSPRGGAVLKGRARKLEWLGELPKGDDGPAALARILLSQSIRPVWLLVDSVDEDYRLEALPHVWGKARHEMLERRLRQLYRGQPFCTAWLQGRAAEGRRDDRFLFTALSDSDWLTPWLSAIQSTGFPLAGVSLISSAAQALLTRLKIRDPQVMLVSRHGAGLRLSYFQNTLLRFSRLTQGEGQDLNCADEVSKTLLYLTSQRIIPREARCAIYLLDLDHDLAPTLASLNADPMFDARLIASEQVARALNVPEEFLLAAPGVALLAAQAGVPPAFNLAPKELRHGFQLHRVRRLLNGAAVACLLGGATAVGAQWAETHQYRSDTQTLMRNLARDETLYQESLKQYPRISIPPDMLRQAVQRARTLESGPRSPENAFAILAKALDQHPPIVLQNLGWRDKLAAGQGQGDHLEIRAQVLPFDGNYRVAVEQIKSFMATLSALPGVTSVTLVEGPVSAAVSSTLSGSTLNKASPSEAHFRLSLNYQGAMP